MYISQILYKGLIGFLSALLFVLVLYAFRFLKNKVKQYKNNNTNIGIAETLSQKISHAANFNLSEFKNIWFTFIVPMFAFFTGIATPFQKYGSYAPYPENGIYTLLVILIMLQSGFYAYKAWNRTSLARQAISIFFLAIAILFCPILGLREDMKSWQIFDVLFAVAATAANIYLLNENNNTTISSEVVMKHENDNHSDMVKPISFRKKRLKQFSVIILAVIILLVILPMAVHEYYYSVLNIYPKLENLQNYKRMPYNFFIEAQKQYSAQPKINNYGDYLIEKARRDENGLPPPYKTYNEFLNLFIKSKLKNNGYIQADEDVSGNIYFLYNPPITTNAYIDNGSLLWRGKKSFIIYIAADKISRMPSYFFSPSNTVYVIYENGIVIEMLEQGKDEFYEIQKKREYAQRKIQFITKCFPSSTWSL